jgi:hypothetical protein
VPRYLVLNGTFIRANGEPSPRRHETGSIITVSDDVVPGASLAALDLDARRAKAAAKQRRAGTESRRSASVAEGRFRAGLSKPVARLLADAEREMDQAEARQKASAT